VHRAVFIVISILATSLLLTAGGCDKEKIVDSTEYIHEVEYIQLPPDTVFSVDTVHHYDSSSVTQTDTVFVTDTVIQVQVDPDTVIIHDTVINTTTVIVHDTVVTIQHHYDTVTVTSFAPNAYLAYTACEDYSDEMVIEYIYENFGYDDGWVFYLSAHQSEISQVSSSTYDIYGYIDYWTPEFDGYYALEYYWRMIYTGGDPSNSANWTINEVPGSASSHQPGLRVISQPETREAIR